MKRKNKKLKRILKGLGVAFTFAILLLSFFVVEKTQDIQVSEEDENYIYVDSSIITNNIPVVASEKVILKPYASDKVEISKKFYDSKASDDEKKNALIFYKDTYMQNSGILYKSGEQFDVVSILDGTVINVKKDEVLGNIVEVKHSDNLISTYSGLSEINVQKDQIISQGELIGKSGKLELGETLENAVLFELIKDGKYVNPLEYYDKKVSEL